MRASVLSLFSYELGAYNEGERVDEGVQPGFDQAQWQYRSSQGEG